MCQFLRNTKLLGLLFCLLLLFPWSFATAQVQGEDITLQFTIYGMYSTNTRNLRDNDMYTTCKSLYGSNLCLEVHADEDAKCYGIFVQFENPPEAWQIEKQVGDQWISVYQGNDDIPHVYVPLDGYSDFRMVKESTESTFIREIRFLSEGEVPSWVQCWNYTPDDQLPAKADLMILVAHPDDEWLYMGGTIPYYHLEQDKEVIVVYATARESIRVAELLNGLWAGGLTTYPVIGDFHDSMTFTFEDGYDRWEYETFDFFLTEQIRRYQPDILISHDVEGEYHHGGHIVCAMISQKVMTKTNDPTYAPDSAERYGAWQVKKLYLHLYPENKITLDFRIPMQNVPGETPLSIAQKAYACHVSQSASGRKVTDETDLSTYNYSCSEYGLAFSTVGMDILKNDFFENIP